MPSVFASFVRETSIRLLSRSRLCGAALDCFLPYLPSDAGTARLYVWLAQAKSIAGDYEAAIDYCDRAIARRPTFGVAYLCRGLALLRQPDHRRAIADLRFALARLCPEGAALARNREPLACCHAALGQR